MIAESLDINTGSLSYIDSETGNPALVFIHGSFIHKEYWKEQYSYFSPKYRIIAPDLAGHGNSISNCNNWTTKRFADDIHELIVKLSLKNVILIGHSYGADIMLETVNNIHASSVIGIIAIDHFKNVGFELTQDLINGILSDLRSEFADTSEQYIHQALITSETKTEISQKVIDDYRGMDPEIGLAMSKELLNFSNRETELLKGLKHKLHLINIHYSPTNETELIKMLGENYELMSLEGTSHFPMIEIPYNLNMMLEEMILKIIQDNV